MINKLRNDTQLLGIVLALISTFCYSLMDVIVKYTLMYTNINYSVFYFQVNLLIFVNLAIFGFAYIKKTLFVINAHPFIVLIRGSISFVNFFFAFYVLKLLKLDIYYSIIFTSPLIATVLATIFLKEKLKIVTVVSISLGMLGVAIITNPFSESFDTTLLLPILLTILLAFSIAATGIITRKYLSQANTLSVSFYIFFICSIFGFLISCYNNGLHTTIIFDPHIFPALFGSAVFCVLGNLLFIQAYRLTPINIVAPTEYALIIWGIIFGYLVFHQTTTIPIIVGALIVILGNFINTYMNHK
ncbi:DMT family transporter [Candidatus Hepatincola sp. Pdp]